MVVLGGITLLPLLTLVTVSLTPLSLTDPAGTFHFDNPLGNYAQLLQDERFVAGSYTTDFMSKWG